MSSRQDSLYQASANGPAQPPAQPAPAAPAQAARPKRNYLIIGMVLFIAYVTLGEFYLPEPLRFTTLMGERVSNMQEIIIDETADEEAQKEALTIERTTEPEAQRQRRIIEETAPAQAEAELLKIEVTAQAQAVATCMQERTRVAQQQYAECLQNRNMTGPTCDYFRDILLDSPCE